MPCVGRCSRRGPADSQACVGRPRRALRFSQGLSGRGLAGTQGRTGSVAAEPVFFCNGRGSPWEPQWTIVWRGPVGEGLAAGCGSHVAGTGPGVGPESARDTAVASGPLESPRPPRSLVGHSLGQTRQGPDSARTSLARKCQALARPRARPQLARRGARPHRLGVDPRGTLLQPPDGPRVLCQ